MLKKGLRKLAIALSAIGPGLFLIGYNIGTGSVTTMAKAGADFGMTLFWAVVLSCVFTYVLMVAYGRLTLVSGKTALNNIRYKMKGGKSIALYIMAALIFGEALALIGVMGIVAELTQEGIRLATNGVFVKTGWIILFYAALLYVLLWFGRYKAFEKVLTFFVILMALCFIGVFFMVKPALSSIAYGMIPGVPNTPGAFGLVAAMAGTTCSAAVFIVRSTVVAEKGWTIDNLKEEKRDSFASATMMLILSGIIMAVSAGTLHVMGLTVNSTIDLIALFEPIGGKAAAYLLILGIVGAGLSTVFPIVLIAPWLISDYTGKPRDLKSPLFRILVFIGLIIAFGSVFLEQSPPMIMIASMAFQAMILPAVAIPAYIFLNRKQVMGNHIASTRMNIALGAVILFSVITTYFAVIDLVTLISG